MKNLYKEVKYNALKLIKQNKSQFDKEKILKVF